MGKAKEKLTALPRRKAVDKKQESRSSVDKAMLVNKAPSLSHIIEALRPLAVPVGDLILDPANARTHGEKDLATIAGSLRVYGQRRPLLVNRRTMVIEAGNGTFQAALSLNWSHIAAAFVEDDPATAAGYSIADNRSAELAGWDDDALGKLMAEVSTGNDPDLDQMMSELAADRGLIPEDPKDQKPPQAKRFNVMVECADQDAQEQLAERLESEGYKVRKMES